MARLPKTFQNITLKKWEKGLIAFSLLLSMTSIFMYATEFPLRKYLFGLQDDEGTKPVGHVVSRSGSVRRQLFGEPEFKQLDVNLPVYNSDTIVTSADSTISLTLDDGSTIDLGASTMVRLTFESGFSFGAIARKAYANIEVVAGTVKGHAKDRKIVVKTKERTIDITRDSMQTVQAAMIKPTIPPKKLTTSVPVQVIIAEAEPIFVPPPAPTPSLIPDADRVEFVQLVAPPDISSLRIIDNSQVAERVVNFEWRIAPENARVKLTLFQVAESARSEVYSDIIAAQKGKGSVAWVVNRPGRYEWEVAHVKGKPVNVRPDRLRSSFVIEPAYQAITMFEPLISGEKTNSNILLNKPLNDFFLAIRWKPYPKADSYKVWFGTSPNSPKPLFEKTVRGTSYTFHQDKVLSGSIFYRVSASVPGGFTVVSDTVPFNFSFLPPRLVVPKDRSVLSKTRLGADEDRILLTWQRTNFTDSYEVEVGRSPDFSSLLIKKRIKENFFSWETPPIGSYWWRVRSYSKDLASTSSAANQITIKP